MSADVLPGFEPVVRSLDDLTAEASLIIEAAKAEHQPSRTFLLMSGGKDSTVLLDACHQHADEIVHINTGIGIPATNEFARRVGRSYGLSFTELHPPESFRSLVLGVWGGFPGPGAHRFTYIRLKQRCVEQLLRDHRSYRGERFLLLTGARSAESKRRMGHAEEVRRVGGQVWVNPLLSWTNAEMQTYRIERALPVNEVAANLHMSGECLCGAMADQDEARSERHAIEFFYPEWFEENIASLERDARAAGLRYCEWGVKRPDDSTPVELPGQDSLFDDYMPLCEGCEFRAPVGAVSRAATEGERGPSGVAAASEEPKP